MKTLNFSPAYLDAMVEEAGRSPRRRQHRSIHTSTQDPSQRLFNAIGMDSYVQPHRHLRDPKAETLIAIRGSFALVIFDDQGRIEELSCFGTERQGAANRMNAGMEIPVGLWHSIVALEPGSIMLEVKAGPFDPAAPREGAPWAPPENTGDGERYLAWLRDEIITRVANPGGG